VRFIAFSKTNIDPYFWKRLEAVSKILRREDDDIREDGRKPPESARRWPCRPSSTRDKADESDSWIASAATEVFLRPLLELIRIG
jgi:hypothetical protein